MIRVTMVALAVACAPPAFAQSPLAQTSKGYAEAVAQSAFGNVTTQAYGGEVGITVGQQIQIFAEGGHVGNVATADLSDAAQTIAAALTLLQPAPVTYSVKQPVSFFGTFGVRYPFAVSSPKLAPYALGGFGLARITKDVQFQLGGSDASVGQYVTLGSDLSGSSTRPMLTLGGGVVWQAWGRLLLDFQYRYGRIFAEDVGINVNRAGLGVGIGF
jgi:opacity protein-like surface antigen